MDKEDERRILIKRLQENISMFAASINTERSAIAIPNPTEEQIETALSNCTMAINRFQSQQSRILASALGRY